MNSLFKALAVTAEVCGTEFSDPAAKAIAIRLSAYTVDAVLKALDKCQVEVHGRLSLAAIIDRIDDGRPSADEAWATAIQASDEAATVVWTSETAKAYWSASSLLEEGDQQAARMAFRDAYNRELSDARQSGMPVKWEVTLGHDKQQREAALLMAAERNRIGLEQVKGLLPYLENGEVPKEALALANKMNSA
jgi:hypothetical protein